MYYGGMGFLIISMIIGMASQANIKQTFARYSKVGSTTGKTGAEVAEMIMRNNGVYDVQIELTPTPLGDHFDPTNKVVRLCQQNYYGTSVAAQAVAAHEIGHVLQHAEQSSLLNFRTSVLPLAQIGSQASGPLILFGLIMGQSSLLMLGIFGLALALLFQLATLPVEFDASNRALKQMRALGLTSSTGENGEAKVLRAAALTYVAAAAVSILQIVRLLLIAREEDR